MNQTIDKQGQVNQVEDLVVSRSAAATHEQVMASYLTHELRAPVTSIRLGLEILHEQINQRLASDEKHMLNLAIKNTNRLNGLVNDIMDYAKIMAGKMNVRRTPCESRQLVTEAVDSLHSWAISKGVRLVKEEGEPLPRIYAESSRIVQILTNLISNAIKFTPTGGKVTVSVKEGDGDHLGTLIFKVKDTGCGIPQKCLEKIFDAFQQSMLHGKQGDGTGLGLTLAKSMVELHEGRIWVESRQGKGSTFTFSVPITPEDLPERLDVYPKPIEFHGMLVHLARKVNAFIAAFI